MSNSQGKHFGQSADSGAERAAQDDTSDQRATGFIPVVTDDPSSTVGDARPSRRSRRVKSDSYRETDPYDLSGRRSRDPRKRRNRIISTLLFIVGIALIAAAVGMYGYSQWQYHEQDVENEKLATYATVDNEGNQPPVVDWAALKAVNPEVVGWVQIPNTVVSFPVYQASDNDKYLHTNAEGNYSLGGQVFMDYQNTEPGMRDAQTIIYGHHLLDGSMFKPVADMADQATFDSHPTVWYVDENNQSYELEPLLVYKTTADDTNVRTLSFMTGDDFHSYLTDLLGRATASRADASAIIAQTSHVLTLVTCNYDNGTGRTVLICVPKSEAVAADAAA